MININAEYVSKLLSFLPRRQSVHEFVYRVKIRQFEKKCSVKTPVVGTEYGREISHKPDMYDCSCSTYDYTVCSTTLTRTIHTIKTIMQ